MWKLLPLPHIGDRLTGFSIPDGDFLWVVSYDGLSRVTMAPEVSVTPALRDELLFEIFDEQRGVLTVDDHTFRMLGLHGGVPILRNTAGDGLSLEPKRSRLTILSPEDEVKQVIEFPDLSGDWRWATFSPDDRYVVIGVPYDLLVYTCESGPAERVAAPERTHEES